MKEVPPWFPLSSMLGDSAIDLGDEGFALQGRINTTEMENTKQDLFLVRTCVGTDGRKG